jgi:hypothetical protein
MKIIWRITVVVNIVVFAGCSFIAKTVNHARKPRIERPVTIINWLEKAKIYNKNIATVEPSSFYLAFTRYNRGPMLFNKKGDFVSVGYNYNGKFCPKSVDEFLKSLYPGFEKGDPTLSNYLLYTSNNSDTVYPKLEQVFKFSRDINGAEGFHLKQAGDVDYTLILPFSIYSGNTIQVKKLRTFLKAVGENRSARINIILLNFDKQQWWGAEWGKKINIYV